MICCYYNVISCVYVCVCVSCMLFIALVIYKYKLIDLSLSGWLDAALFDNIMFFG